MGWVLRSGASHTIKHAAIATQTVRFWLVQRCCAKGHASNMSKKCARCEKTVYPTEELKCLDKVCFPFVSGSSFREPSDVLPGTETAAGMIVHQCFGGNVWFSHFPRFFFSRYGTSPVSSAKSAAWPSTWGTTRGSTRNRTAKRECHVI